jgi:tetratricopeptide (TPR) repeat protein
MAYYGRGFVYDNLKQYQRAVADYDQAIRLNPEFAKAYANRGLAYTKLGQHLQAVKDFDEAIRLKPDFADAYGNRGNAYILSGNGTEGCRSLVRACELGECKPYETAKKEGSCQ